MALWTNVLFLYEDEKASEYLMQALRRPAPGRMLASFVSKLAS